VEQANELLNVPPEPTGPVPILTTPIQDEVNLIEP
jgi:hypothetical protein